MMLHRNRAILALAVLPVLAAGLVACGSSSNSSDPTTTATAAATGGEAVATRSVAGTGDVLVDSKGDTLYTNDMDSAGKVACTGECTSIWIPLAAPSGGQPTSSNAAIESKLGSVMRPDGTSQVTFDDKPLYSFVQDSPGQATGDGVSDSFGGTSFVWTAATNAANSAGSSSAGSGGTTTTTQQSSGGNGGSMY
jgi:predicted lipoprotein with Yx(FWY)xxD motif